jgi:formate hydrogenlyase subunit 6/NADH:ubiquinone oxidoreductase subunit I
MAKSGNGKAKKNGNGRMRSRGNGKVGAVLVIGGGIAGIQASLDLAESGQKVYLLESSPAIGGVMATLDKTFPTNDCSTCILSPKLVEAGRHLNIELLTWADLESVEGEVGHFSVQVKKRPRYVDPEKCTACGLCGKVDVPAVEDLVEHDGLLWTKRIAVDEIRCVQCGDCVRACRTENPEKPAMSSVFHRQTEQESEGRPATAVQLTAARGMSPERRMSFWQHHMAKCIKCYGCRDVCPVFFSDECRLEDWATPGGLPPDAPVYHLARAYYISERCTHCGFCEETCPSNLPLRALVDVIRHEEPAELFDYVPGLTAKQRNAVVAAFPRRKEEARV